MKLSHLAKVLALSCSLTIGAAHAAEQLSKSDMSFMSTAAQSGQLEIEASTLARKVATSPEVQSFADRMVTDHTKAAEELKALAKAKGVKLPVGLSPADEAKIDALGKLQGEQFDKQYAEQIGVAAHKKAVTLFKNATQNAKDADVKAYAEKTLPVLEQHYKMGQEMNDKLQKGQ